MQVTRRNDTELRLLSLHNWLILLPAIITTFPQFPAYKVIIGNLRAPDSMLERPAEVRLRAIGEGVHVLLVLGFPNPPPPTRNYHHHPTLPTQSLQLVHSLPLGSGPSSPLTSLTMN